jgi:hypothetical protein
MIRKIASVVAVVAVVVMGRVAPIGAHAGHEHKLMGTVTMVGADHVMFKDKDGKTVTVFLKSDTKILQGKTAMKLGDIKANQRIVVGAVEVEEKGKARMEANSIELGGAPAAK